MSVSPIRSCCEIALTGSHSAAGSLAAQDPEAYAWTLLGYADADIERELPSVTCPVLIIAGKHDVLLPSERAQAVHRAIPHSQYMLFEDAAHFLPYQAPEKFATAVHEFVSDIRRD